jgi:hypothetical protein
MRGVNIFLFIEENNFFLILESAHIQMPPKTQKKIKSTTKGRRKRKIIPKSITVQKKIKTSKVVQKPKTLTTLTTCKDEVKEEKKISKTTIKKKHMPVFDPVNIESLKSGFVEYWCNYFGYDPHVYVQYDTYPYVYIQPDRDPFSLFSYHHEDDVLAEIQDEKEDDTDNDLDSDEYDAEEDEKVDEELEKMWKHLPMKEKKFWKDKSQVLHRFSIEEWNPPHNATTAFILRLGYAAEVWKTLKSDIKQMYEKKAEEAQVLHEANVKKYIAKIELFLGSYENKVQKPFIDETEVVLNQYLDDKNIIPVIISYCISPYLAKFRSSSSDQKNVLKTDTENAEKLIHSSSSSSSSQSSSSSWSSSWSSKKFKTLV